MTGSTLSRRRLLTISAAACAGSVVGAKPLQHGLEWTGPVLGGEGRLVFDGITSAEARSLVGRVIGEIDRLEAVFSLHRSRSEISRLNQTGELHHPSHDLRHVLSAALRMWQRSDGLFNPAIQPLWQLLARHFSHPASTSEPDPADIAGALARCDPAQIEISAEAIRLAPGMALTLNGIAQGYIADQVVAMLAGAGLDNALIQLGETRALPGRHWPLTTNQGRHRFALHNAAVATSAGHGNRFTQDGRWHHLIDPSTGRSADQVAFVTVRAPDALTADALSTALAVAPASVLEHLAGRFEYVSVVAGLADASILEFGEPWSADIKSGMTEVERRS